MRQKSWYAHDQTNKRILECGSYPCVFQVNSAVIEVKKAPLMYQKDATARVAQYRRTLTSLKRQLVRSSVAEGSFEETPNVV